MKRKTDNVMSFCVAISENQGGAWYPLRETDVGK